ncbi:MAG: hypothetical protein H0V09_00275 [Gemmatimonadetes bacterium]|nr:hypothetical protein [Gemmatimonadota bacterium]
MATLNIKNIPDALYKALQSRARKRRRSVTQEAIQIIADAVEQSEPLSIMELEGLGKDVWAGIDPASYVDQERQSWD